MDRNGDNRAVAIMSLFSVRKQEYFDRIKPICVFILRRESIKEVDLSYQLRNLIYECFTIKKSNETGKKVNFWSIIKMQREIYFPAEKSGDHRFAIV